jgi:gluconate kinase
MRTVWLSGNSGAGKTFTGDYLARVCGFFHIDGDAPFFSTSVGSRAQFDDFVNAFAFWFREVAAPPVLWQPYLTNLCAAVRAAHAAGCDDVVVSLNVYHREARDFLRALLPAHEFIVLSCNCDETVRRARRRFAAYAAASGQTLQQSYEENYKEPFTEDAFAAQTVKIMRHLQPLASDEVRAHVLDVSDGEPWRELHRILELAPPPAAIPLDEIAQTNYARFLKLPPATAWIIKPSPREEDFT